MFEEGGQPILGRVKLEQATAHTWPYPRGKKALVSLTSSNDTEDSEHGPRSASGVMEIIPDFYEKGKVVVGTTNQNHPTPITYCIRTLS